MTLEAIPNNKRTEACADTLRVRPYIRSNESEVRAWAANCRAVGWRARVYQRNVKAGGYLIPLWVGIATKPGWRI